MKQDPKLIVTLEARCYSWEHALKLQELLGEIVSNNDLAGKHLEECTIHYVDPSEVKEAVIVS